MSSSMKSWSICFSFDTVAVFSSHHNVHNWENEKLESNEQERWQKGARFNNCLIICYHPKQFPPLERQLNLLSWTCTTNTSNGHRSVSSVDQLITSSGTRTPNLSTPRQALPCIPHVVTMNDHFFPRLIFFSAIFSRLVNSVCFFFSHIFQRKNDDWLTENVAHWVNTKANLYTVSLSVHANHKCNFINFLCMLWLLPFITT